MDLTLAMYTYNTLTLHIELVVYTEVIRTASDSFDGSTGDTGSDG